MDVQNAITFLFSNFQRLKAFSVLPFLLRKIFLETLRSSCSKEINHLMIHGFLIYLKYGEVLNQANESPLYVYLSVTDRKTSRKMNPEQK